MRTPSYAGDAANAGTARAWGRTLRKGMVDPWRDPDVGRFTARDPLGLAGGEDDPYGYYSE